jgi:hypothetical protein
VTHAGAAPAEGFRNLGGRLAPVLLVVQVEESDAHGDDLRIGQIRAVAALVPPLLVRGVGSRPVEFDAKQVILIEVVQVATAGMTADASLAPRSRQAVGSFHVPNVTEFQRGEGAAASVAER